MDTQEQSQRDEIQQLRQELEAERTAFEAERSAWLNRREEIERLLAQRAERLAPELLDVEKQHTAQVGSAEQQHKSAAADATADSVDSTNCPAGNNASPLASDGAGEVTISTSASTDPTSADYDPIAALERLRQLAQSEIDESEEETATAELSPPGTPRSPELSSDQSSEQDSSEEPSSKPAHSEEDSIDDYMAQLLQRLRGQGPSAGLEPSSPVLIHEQPELTQPTDQDSQSHMGASGDPDRDESAESAERNMPPRRVQRAQPPDLASNLSAMREVANTSARAAIEHSSRRQWSRTAIGKLVLAVIMLFFAVLVLLSGLSFLNVMVFVVALGAALFWGLQGSFMMKSLVQKLTGGRVSDAPKEGSDDADTNRGTREKAKRSLCIRARKIRNLLGSRKAKKPRADIAAGHQGEAVAENDDGS